ncbi:MAG: hypothetical protein J6V20_05005 [Bacteroidaceae bacterium]|jgi:hypothetical protein|nr:hypothetical protein [Bacteroidaceae bacterium]
MSSSGNGGCISFVLWLIISVIITAITDSVLAGMIGGGIAIFAIAYLLTKD